MSAFQVKTFAEKLKGKTTGVYGHRNQHVYGEIQFKKRKRSVLKERLEPLDNKEFSYNYIDEEKIMNQISNFGIIDSRVINSSKFTHKQ